MNHLSLTSASRFCLSFTPSACMLRVGRREILICRDMRKRYYSVNPVLECSTGIARGYIEILLLKKWLVIFSPAH